MVVAGYCKNGRLCWKSRFERLPASSRMVREMLVMAGEPIFSLSSTGHAQEVDGSDLVHRHHCDLVRYLQRLRDAETTTEEGRGKTRNTGGNEGKRQIRRTRLCSRCYNNTHHERAGRGYIVESNTRFAIKKRKRTWNKKGRTIIAYCNESLFTSKAVTAKAKGAIRDSIWIIIENHTEKTDEIGCRHKSSPNTSKDHIHLERTPWNGRFRILVRGRNLALSDIHIDPPRSIYPDGSALCSTIPKRKRTDWIARHQ